ncbi:MAG TPA: hypothetical protein VH912_30655 [Streptosporangiaceae bacterium]|jgi:hypothetical protein
MFSPDALEGQFTLRTATARYDELRTREALSGDEWSDADVPPLGRDEALELLALSVVIARKASYGRQLTVRTARAQGASWSQIGAALGTSKQAAWEAHDRWIDELAEEHRRSGYGGMAPSDAAAAHALAGTDAGHDKGTNPGRDPATSTAHAGTNTAHAGTNTAHDAEGNANDSGTSARG